MIAYTMIDEIFKYQDTLTIERWKREQDIVRKRDKNLKKTIEPVQRTTLYDATIQWKVKQERAQGGCLGTESRRKT